MRQILHFSHANSFPAGCYRIFLSGLAEEYDIRYIEALGHDARYPVTDHWPHLVTQTIHAIEQYGQPVVAVGHSLGGYLTLLAALQRPDLFRAIVILDSPVLGPWRARGLWLAKKMGQINRVTPGGNTLRRRDQWLSVEEALHYFASKAVFAQFDLEVLRDYAELGTEPWNGGRRLRFRPEIEHRIYCTLPHTWSHLKGQLKVPAAFCLGRDSRVVRPADLTFMRRHFPMTVHELAGGHLFPLEQPRLSATRVRAVLHELIQ